MLRKKQIWKFQLVLWENFLSVSLFVYLWFIHLFSIQLFVVGMENFTYSKNDYNKTGDIDGFSQWEIRDIDIKQNTDLLW